MYDGSSPSPVLMVIANGITAMAYYWLTYQLLAFAVNSKVIKLTETLRNHKDKDKRSLFYMLFAVAVLFAFFIALCGNTHTLGMLKYFYPQNRSVHAAQVVMLVLCAAVSFVTSIIGSKLFPVILESLSNFELNAEGNLQHAENYLIEVVELVKESIIVLSEEMKIVRCNEASKLLLCNGNLVDKTYTDFIHPADIHIFKAAVNNVLGSYSMTPVTIEYRVNQQAHAPSPRNTNVKPASLGSSSNSSIGKVNTTRKVHIAPSSPRSSRCAAASTQQSVLTSGDATRTVRDVELIEVQDQSQDSITVFSQCAGNDVNYIWVESTVCKGMSMNHRSDIEYDIKLVSRNIEDRKKLEVAQYNNIMKESEERARTNAAKLRYISCIAHDLKTPLQSFCFTLDLMSQTRMSREQMEYVQQSNVAVDLMKLTISQTMDISKALTGAKLMPRRTTVYLSSVMNRVEIIINGYGKQVPVTFKLARNVCDRIITDEEWLWQMVLNLLTNACKYTDCGEISVTVTKTFGSAALNQVFKDEMLLVEVVDTGVGVADGKIVTLFDAFSQVQEGQVTGTGLGLFGVRTRAEGLLGSCGARHNTESSTGTGTVLWFAIPYTPDEIANVSRNGSYLDEAFIESSVAPAHIPPPPESPQFSLYNPREELGNVEEQHASISPSDLASRSEWLIRSRKITAIVVDDTLTVRKLMERLLLKMGFESVVCYENGSKGLNALMAGQVDIVFSDVQMPIMTGPEMVRRFRLFETEALAKGSRSQRQLVVAVTANGSELGGSNTGFDEVCPKPLSVQEIYNLVQKYFQ